MVKIQFYVKASLVTGCLAYTYYNYSNILLYQQQLKQKFLDFKEAKIQKFKDHYEDERVQQKIEKIKETKIQATEIKNQLKEIISDEEKINEIKAKAQEKVERAKQIKDGIKEKVKENEKLNNIARQLKSFKQNQPLNLKQDQEAEIQSQINSQNIVENKEQNAKNTVLANNTEIQQNILNQQKSEEREIELQNQTKDQVKNISSSFFKKVERAQNLKEDIKKNLEKKIEERKQAEQISEPKLKLFSKFNKTQDSTEQIAATNSTNDNQNQKSQ